MIYLLSHSTALLAERSWVISLTLHIKQQALFYEGGGGGLFFNLTCTPKTMEAKTAYFWPVSACNCLIAYSGLL